MSKNLRGLSARKGMKENLFMDLSVSVPSDGISVDEHLNDLADKYLFGRASVLSASTFYDFLSAEHKDKKVYVCDGTACLVSGNQQKVRDVLLEKFADEEIGSVSCLGHCYSGRAFMKEGEILGIVAADDQFKSGDSAKDESGIMKSYSRLVKPVLLNRTDDPAEFYGVLDKYMNDIPLALKEIEIAELRGRGGAGFPLHVKLRTAASTPAKKKYIVCNADEGDPGAFSDRWLLENTPHSVLFGMVAAGLIIGSNEGILYIRGEYPDAIRSVGEAIAEFRSLNLKFPDTDGSSSGFVFHIISGQGAYICGEETALLNSIEGLRPEVRSRPPFPATYGLFGQPTVLCNVETYANFHFILKEGGLAYSALGTIKSKGTKLISLDSSFRNPGLFEVEMGTPLSEVLNEMGGGTIYPVRAFQIGGPLGGIVPAAMIDRLTVDYESFIREGFLLGHAGVVSIPADFSMMEFLCHLFEFIAKESCGKCFPCRLGSMRGLEMVKAAVAGTQPINRELFNDLLETMQLGSLCALGGGITLPVTNALTWFGEELSVFFSDYKRVD
jgi:NADH:ubiquinone oxidoreductase subunit F (NADH-binding)